MIHPALKKIAKKEDWYRAKNSVFGLYKDYFFTLGNPSFMNQESFKYVVASIPNLNEELLQVAKKELETKKDLLQIKNIEFGEDYIYVELLAKRVFTKIETIYVLLDFFVKLFKKNSIPKMNSCYKCGCKKGKLNYYTIDETGVIYCNTCQLSIKKLLQNIAEKDKSEEKNYLAGFIGSIIFSIPGIVLWVIVAVFFEKIAAVIALVFVALGLTGYDYFKGKYGKLTLYILVLSNIICIIISNYATAVFLLYQENLSLKSIFYEMSINENLTNNIFDNIVLSFILTSFIWIGLFFTLKHKNSTLELARKM